MELELEMILVVLSLKPMIMVIYQWLVSYVRQVVKLVVSL